MNITALQIEESGTPDDPVNFPDPIFISWWDFEHPNVFLMAVSKDKSKPFELELQFSFEEVLGLPTAVKVFLILFLVIGFISSIIFGVYKLHTKGIIEVRIPKPLRIQCFKNYKSPEEKAEERAAREKERKTLNLKELKIRMAMNPTGNGF